MYRLQRSNVSKQCFVLSIMNITIYLSYDRYRIIFNVFILWFRSAVICVLWKCSTYESWENVYVRCYISLLKFKEEEKIVVRKWMFGTKFRYRFKRLEKKGGTWEFNEKNPLQGQWSDLVPLVEEGEIFQNKFAIWSDLFLFRNKTNKKCMIEYWNAL